ncbi:MAG TPA: molybdenum cofactor guanylyltransferase [Chthoniobacterales bacterium]|jgi:molybdopterin-guanine dinucleotide biosynthesis protein A
MRCSAVLLAGGKSTRMGRDKALLEIEGEPLWRRQLATLRQLSPEQLMISGPERDGAEAVADEIENAGPLAGVAAALRKCTAPLLIVLAVDLPRMTAEFLQSLLNLCRDGRGAVPRGREFFEPLAAIYPSNCVPLAEVALRRGDFAMHNFVRTAVNQKLLMPRLISAEESALFANLNTPADL